MMVSGESQYRGCRLLEGLGIENGRDEVNDKDNDDGNNIREQM